MAWKRKRGEGMWKVILWIIGKKRENLSRAIKFRGENYIVSIHKFISAEKELSEWKAALDKSQGQTFQKEPSSFSN